MKLPPRATRQADHDRNDRGLLVLFRDLFLAHHRKETLSASSLSNGILFGSFYGVINQARARLVLR